MSARVIVRGRRRGWGLQLQVDRRIARQDLALDQVADQPADAREMAALAGGRKSPIGQTFEVAGQSLRLDRVRLRAHLAAEGLKLAQIVSVGFARIAAQSALDRLAIQMAVDGLIPADCFQAGVLSTTGAASPPSSLASNAPRNSRIRSRSVILLSARSLM